MKLKRYEWLTPEEQRKAINRWSYPRGEGVVYFYTNAGLLARRSPVGTDPLLQIASLCWLPDRLASRKEEAQRIRSLAAHALARFHTDPLDSKSAFGLLADALEDAGMVSDKDRVRLFWASFRFRESRRIEDLLDGDLVDAFVAEIENEVTEATSELTLNTILHISSNLEQYNTTTSSIAQQHRYLADELTLLEEVGAEVELTGSCSYRATLSLEQFFRLQDSLQQVISRPPSFRHLNNVDALLPESYVDRRGFPARLLELEKLYRARQAKETS